MKSHRFFCASREMWQYFYIIKSDLWIEKANPLTKLLIFVGKCEALRLEFNGTVFSHQSILTIQSIQSRSSYWMLELNAQSGRSHRRTHTILIVWQMIFSDWNSMPFRSLGFLYVIIKIWADVCVCVCVHSETELLATEDTGIGPGDFDLVQRLDCNLIEN